MQLYLLASLAFDLYFAVIILIKVTAPKVGKPLMLPSDQHTSSSLGHEYFRASVAHRTCIL